MAELLTLEEKLAEVIGLAEAAQKATEKVEGLVDDDSVASKLQQMREEAEETARRGTEVAERRDGKKTAIRETGEEAIAELTQWALPIQERHFSETKECALQLAGEKDPYEAS
jgi:hypothetical protein